MSLSEPSKSPRELAGSLTLSILWVAVTIIGLCLTPDTHGHGTHQHLGLPPCPSVMLFDRPCPGCGLTTSWTALLHGNLPLAFSAHALGPFLYLGYTIFALTTFAFALTRRRWHDGPWVNRGMVALFVVFVSYGGIRMAFTPHYAMMKERVFAALPAH